MSLKSLLSSTLLVKMPVKNTPTISNFQRQVWVYLCQDPKTSKACPINSLLPSGYCLRNWTLSHSSLTSLIEVTYGVKRQICVFSTSSLQVPMKIQTSCSLPTILLVTAIRSYWTSGLTLASARDKSRPLLLYTIRCSCQLSKATSERHWVLERPLQLKTLL